MTRVIRNIAVLSVATCILFVIACSPRITPLDIPSPGPPEATPAPRALNLPADDAAHHAPIEWWYYNGHLISNIGTQYAFHFVIFQTQADEDAVVFEVGHSGITDIGSGEHINMHSNIFRSIEPRAYDTSDNLIELDLGNFALEIGNDGSHAFSASDAAGLDNLRLQINPPSATMLHQEIGWMEWPFGWTYYYSYPRMKASGTITIGGREIAVNGDVWFDHQWGDFFVVGKPAGWQWFAIHLDDGSSLMISEVRGVEGEVLSIDGTLISSDSNHQVMDADKDGITIDVKDHWVSTATGGRYPSLWRLRVAAIDLDVMMKATVADQEVPASPYGNQAAAYWEGRVDVRDALSGNIVGRGFAELSGYVDPAPLIWRAETPLD